MDPIIGNIGNRNKTNVDIKRPLTTKQDIPHLFLNQLMNPLKFLNSEAVKINFKPENIIILCDLA